MTAVMEAPAAEIELDGIDKRYGDKPVLEGFSLRVMPGEFITAIGSSGCGKTTVLKLINGLLQPDGGKVLIKGTDIAGVDQNRLRRGIGYVIQGMGLFPHMLVSDNIGYVPSLEHWPKARIAKRVEELAGIVSLEPELLKSYPGQLSGGQRQRVGIARALAAKPDIMLMDEPFGAVDDITRKSLQRELKRIHRDLGITIFFITHDIGEALRLGTRVMVMDQGRIEQLDKPEAIRRAPASEFVRQLVTAKNTSLVRRPG